MELKLISLEVENFKSFRHAKFDFGGRDASIYGQNGTGKTSVYDAVTWLLFGKDSRGKSDFDIKPLTPEGDVKDHGAVASVEALFSIDGREKKLARSYREVWSKKRGNPEAFFDGHTSDYFIDGVPMKKSEFARQVGKIVEEDLFRLLTSVSYFAEELPWQKRRAILFDLETVAADQEIMAGDSRFALLAAAMEGLTLDDYRKKLAAQRKGLNKTLDDVPSRMDECQKTIGDLRRIDFDALERQRAEAQQRRTAAQRDLDQAERDGGQTELQNRLAGLRNQLGRLENENTAWRLAQKQTQGADEASSVWQSLNEIHARENRRREDIAYLRQREQRLKEEIAACRARWDEISREKFQGGICPACGQTLPQGKLEAAKAAFERDKARQKGEAVEAANRAKAALEGIREEIAKLERESARSQKQMEELAIRLRQLESAPKAEIADMADYAVRRAELEAQAASVHVELEGLEMKTAARVQICREMLARADGELERLSGQLSKKAALEYARGRMEELRTQAAAAADQRNKLDGMLFLCEEFLRYKAKFVEDSVNRRFSLARFRLFRQQINGGLEDCCDATVDGVPYATSLNTGARISAGIDIINALSRHYGVHVPLFIDNAESVTRLERADTQVIRLAVSENDTELRCELQ